MKWGRCWMTRTSVDCCMPAESVLNCVLRARDWGSKKPRLNSRKRPEAVAHAPGRGLTPHPRLSWARGRSRRSRVQASRGSPVGWAVGFRHFENHHMGACHRLWVWNPRGSGETHSPSFLMVGGKASNEVVAHKSGGSRCVYAIPS